MQKIEMKEADAKEIRNLNEALGASTAKIGQLARQIHALEREQAQFLAKAEKEGSLLQDRIGSAAKRYEVNLEDATGKWNLDLSTGVFTFMTNEEIEEEAKKAAAAKVTDDQKH